MARDIKLENEANTGNTAELQAQIALLKEDIASIAATLADIGSQKLDDVKSNASEAYHAAYEQGEDTLNSLKDCASSCEQQLTDYVQERPLTSLAAAAALGYFFSVLTRR